MSGRALLAPLALLAALAPIAPASGQLSPGPLARAHRALEGTLSCTKCHGPKRDALSAGCLSCHREVAWLMQRQRGFHARQAGVTTRSCESCHPDHAGERFNLVSWPGGAKERFDHGEAGWPLEQSHADVTCEKCHAVEYRVSEAARLSRRTNGAGWIGLEQDCWSCHRGDDAHKGALDRRCETCHDADTWERAPKFDHAATDYPLTGRHADVECAKCHLAPRLHPRRDAKGELVPVYEPVPFTTCGSCHEDPHRGSLSGACTQCHTTQSFAVERGRGFNHSATRYALTGRHRAASCEACHGTNLANARPPFATCSGCHKDPHAGEATLAGKATDCGTCHDLNGFRPSTYSTLRHASAALSLEGKHRQVECRACHSGNARASVVTDAMFRFRVAARRCADCHVDAHDGAFASRASGGACEGCHAVAGWSPSTFTAAQHAALRLPLEGKHAAIACAACHVSIPGRGRSAAWSGQDLRVATTPARARGASRTDSQHVTFVARPAAACGACHVDPHGGRFRGEAKDGGECRVCHASARFRPAAVELARHQRFGFALEGAHRATACADCHAELNRPPASSTILARASGVTPFPAPTAPAATRSCATCHATPHGAQFEGRRGGSACETCHGVDRFAPATLFDHERDSGFSLRGAHAKVACAACHPAAGEGVLQVVRYRPLSTTCESCHGGRPSGGHS